MALPTSPPSTTGTQHLSLLETRISSPFLPIIPVLQGLVSDWPPEHLASLLELHRRWTTGDGCSLLRCARRAYTGRDSPALGSLRSHRQGRSKSTIWGVFHPQHKDWQGLTLGKI